MCHSRPHEPTSIKTIKHANKTFIQEIDVTFSKVLQKYNMHKNSNNYAANI